METINLKDFKKESRKRRVKNWFNERKIDVQNFYYNNKELVIASVPFIGAGIVFITKQSIKHHNINKEKEVKELYCYDRSLGHYWRLKRELTNSEWVEIDKRKKSGERLADILDELRVLK